MTTRTFAKKSGRQHGNVMTMLRKMVANGLLDLEESYYTNGNGSTQFSEYKLTINDFEKIQHRLTDKELKGVRRYFGVKPTAEVVVAESATAPPALVKELAEVIAVQSDALTMSSREIATLTGSSHDNVLKTVRGLINKGLVSENDTPYVHPQNGQTYREFQLSYRDTMVVVSGYSPELRARIIDRWQELESRTTQPAFAIPTTFAAALILAGELEQQRAALTQQVEVQVQKITEDAPKVEFYEDVAVAEGCHTVKQVADMLKTGRNELYRFLRKHKVLIEHGKDHNLPYQVQKTAGRFTVLEEPYKHPYTGKITLGTRTMVTGKGLIFIRELIEEHGRVELDRTE
jgi:phage antirepressor YoqD-like protein